MFLNEENSNLQMYEIKNYKKLTNAFLIAFDNLLQFITKIFRKN